SFLKCVEEFRVTRCGEQERDCNSTPRLRRAAFLSAQRAPPISCFSPCVSDCPKLSGRNRSTKRGETEGQGCYPSERSFPGDAHADGGDQFHPSRAARTAQGVDDLAVIHRIRRPTRVPLRAPVVVSPAEAVVCP